MIASVTAPQRSSATPRSAGHRLGGDPRVDARGQPNRTHVSRTRADVGSDPPRDRHRHTRILCAGVGLDRHPTGLLAGRQTAGSWPSRARLYSAALSTVHSPYALSPEVQLVVGRVADRRRTARPGYRHRDPRTQGEGARRLRRDVDLAEPAARLSDRARARRGPDRRGHRRQPVPRLRGRHRGQLDRPFPSPGGRRDQGAGRRAHPFLGLGLLPADLPGGLSRAGPAGADVGSRPGLPRQLGHRGRRGLDQACTLRHEAAVRGGLPRSVPRPDLWLGLADRVQGEVPRRLRPAPAGHLPRSVRAGRGPALVRRGAVRQARAGRRSRGHHRRADPGRGRLPRP